MENFECQLKIIDVDKIELDPNKVYLIKVGESKEMGRENWAAYARAFQEQLKSVGIHNFLVMPHDIKTEIIEQDN